MEATPDTISLQVEGMTCANCALSVRKTLEKKGAEQVDVNFATGEVRFTDATTTPVQNYTNSIEDLGFKVISAEEPGKKKSS